MIAAPEKIRLWINPDYMVKFIPTSSFCACQQQAKYAEFCAIAGRLHVGAHTIRETLRYRGPCRRSPPASLQGGMEGSS
jgi:hypothetical protein